MSRATEIIVIPASENASGDSSGRMSQLSIAPETGMRNFQIFRFDTFTPGRRSNVFQMVIAAADKKLSHASAA